MIEIQIDIAAASAAFATMSRRSIDMSSLFVDVKGILDGAKQRAFTTESNPTTGEAWAELAESTQKKKYKGVRRGPDHKLRLSDALFGSIASDSGRDFAEIGTPLAPYPSYLFTGTTRMPAREFIGIDANDERSIVTLALAYLALP